MEKEPQQHEMRVVVVKEPRTIWNTALGLLGIVGTIVASDSLKDAAYKKFKDTTSPWAQIKKADGFLTVAKKVVLSTFDPKQWKSTLVEWGAILAGVVATNFLVDKIYNRTKPEILPVPEIPRAPVSKTAEAPQQKSWAATEQAKAEATVETQPVR